MVFSATKGYLTKPKPGVMLNPLHPLSQGLVGYWLFNEGSGSKGYDISGHGNHGTLKNMSPNAQNSGWGGSKFGGGLHFDGSDDYVNCGNDASMSPAAAISVAAWVKTSDFASHRYIVTCDTVGASKGYSLRTYSGGAVNCLFQLAGLSYSSASGNIISGGWNHVVGVYDGSKVVLYINGIANIGSTISGDIAYNDRIVRIGKRDTGSHFAGSIDSVLVYNRAVSVAEVKTLYHTPFCNLLRVPVRYVPAAPAGAIMNQFQRANIGADLYNGAIIA